MQSASAQIYKAIADDDYEGVRNIFAHHPNELNVPTFMAGQTWLGYAAQAGKLSAVKALVEIGADPNIGDETYGAKPLCSACSNGHQAIAEYLLEHGADLDTETSARNPLFSAIVGRSPECVRTILTVGIDAAIRYDSDTMRNMDAAAFALMRGERECAAIIARWNAGGDEAAASRALARADEIAQRNAHASSPRER
jgi:ankyrin repeat protein